MSWSATEEIRIEAIEKMLNDLQLAVNKLATKGELRASVMVRQKEIDDLRVRVTALESQLAALQSA